MSEVYRNHPTVMIQNIILFMFFLVIFLFSFMKEGITIFHLLCAAIIGLAVIAVMVYLFWWSATITFTDTEVVVEHNLLYKKRKTVPYEKIASVNVVRNIFNRIFGTTTLSINVNSSMNAARADVSFVFKTDLANSLRSELNDRMFNKQFTVEKEVEYESLTHFEPKDAVLYGLIGGSTVQTAIGLFFFVYSVLSVIFLQGTGLLIALLLLLVNTVIPMIASILRYYNLRIYRVENTIYLQHGMIQTYRSSFDIKKINAIRIREPWIARLMHKCCLEAEVVGINASAKDVTPLLSLLMSRAEIDSLVKELLPEFVVDIPMEHQEKRSLLPMLSRNTLYCAIFAAILAYPNYWLVFESEAFMVANVPMIDDISILMIRFALLVFTLAVIVLSYVSVFIALRINEFGLGKDMFKLVIGVMDRKTITIQYDRVQISQTFSSPMMRRRELARCNISLLSSAGYSNIKTGFFDEKELSKISTTMLERLSNGEYDYHRTSI